MTGEVVLPGEARSAVSAVEGGMRVYVRLMVDRQRFAGFERFSAHTTGVNLGRHLPVLRGYNHPCGYDV